MPSRPNAQVARRGRLQNRRQGQLEVGRGPRRQVGPRRPADARAQRPDGAPVRVLRPDLLQPAAVERQEVAEPLRLGVERRLKERGVPRREPVDLALALAQFLEQNGQQERAGVVVGAVALREVRDRVRGVLEHPGRVGHPRQVVEPPVGQVGLLLGEGAHRERLVRLVLAAQTGLLERLHVVLARTAPRSSRGPAGTPARTSRPPRVVAEQSADFAARAPSGRRTAPAPRGRRRAAPRRASTASRRPPCRTRTRTPACPT